MLELAAHLFFREAWRALARNRLRSALAALAIMIGIAAVVCVVAIGRAGSRRAEEQLQNLGENFVWIEAGSRAPSGVRTGPHGTTRLTLSDAEGVARNPLIKRMTPNVDGNAHVVYGDRNWHTHWRGIDVTYFDIKHWDVALGAHFLEEDVRGARSVVLLGQTVREQLFGDRDPIGEVVRINVRMQFLGEAVMLTVLGGLLGVLLGTGTCLALGHALGWSIGIPPDAIAVAPLISATVGVFFGFYPATRAARLDPIAALHHE